MRRLNPFRWLAGGAPKELGQSHAQLPVTHVRTDVKRSKTHKNHHADERGIWMYYARGCSDLYYDVGRTLGGRNKVDVALKLAQRLTSRGRANTSPEKIVANYLRAGPLRPGSRHRKLRYVDAIDNLESLLIEAALGPFALIAKGPRGAPGRHYAGAPFCNATFMALSGAGKTMTAWLDTMLEERRTTCIGACAAAELAAAITLFEFLDEFLIEKGRVLRFDSLQFLQQPQGGYAFYSNPHRWTVELLDLRFARFAGHVVESHRDSFLSRYLSGPPQSAGTRPTSTAASSGHAREPAQCTPACWFACCLACKESPLTLRHCLMSETLAHFERRTTATTGLARAFINTSAASAGLARHPRINALPCNPQKASTKPQMVVPTVSFCSQRCAAGDVGATQDVRDGAMLIETLQTRGAVKGLGTGDLRTKAHQGPSHGHRQGATSKAVKGRAVNADAVAPATADACADEGARRDAAAAAELQLAFNEGDGLVLRVLPCSFQRSRFAVADMSACVLSELERRHTATSWLRRDLPNAIYTGGRLGGNTPRPAHPNAEHDLWLEPHAGEHVNTDVGYDGAIGWVLRAPPPQRRGGAFPHDAWVEELPLQLPLSAATTAAHSGGRSLCPAHRSPHEYAQARLDYFHSSTGSAAAHEGRPRWKEFIYGGRGYPRSRAAQTSCYHSTWEAAAKDQMAYVALLAATNHSSKASGGGSRRKSSSWAGGVPHHPIGAEAEFGSGFCFSYNQVHLDWTPAEIAAIFYVNDSLSTQLVSVVGPRAHRRGEAASHQATSELHADGLADVGWQRTRALAAQTKLLPRAMRRPLGAGASHKLAQQLQALSLERADRAYKTALHVQRWLRSRLGLLALRRSAEPLPVLQYRVSRECFDMHAVQMRVHRSSASSAAPQDDDVLSVPPRPSPESCTSRVDGLDVCPWMGSGS